jgi:hypothetical protein
MIIKQIMQWLVILTSKNDQIISEIGIICSNLNKASSKYLSKLPDSIKKHQALPRQINGKPSRF